MKLTVEQRIQMIADYESGSFSMMELAAHYKLSYPKVHKWISRYRKLGWNGLKNKSREQWHHPLETKKDIWRQVAEMKEKNPSWGAKTLRKKLLELSVSVPSQSTISEFLRRNGLRVPPKTEPDKKIEELVSGHLNIARSCVQQWSWDDYAEAWSVAMRALQSAAEDFDRSRGMAFKSYAFKIIKLRLLDYQRQSLGLRLKHKPVFISLEEMGSTRGGRNDDLVESMAVDIEDPNVEMPWVDIDRKERWLWLDVALKEIGNQHRAILIEFYRSGGTFQSKGHKTQEKLGMKYGVSASRISQICKRTVKQLRRQAEIAFSE